MIKDNAVLYNQVQEGIDVQYTILDNNIKEDIVLQKKAEIPEYKYELVLDGLEAVEEDGVICLYEEGSREETIYVLEAPIMMDAAGAISMNITLSLQTEEGRTYLVVTPDQEWLNSEERQYPVRIDPTTVNVTREYFSLIDVEQGAPDTIVGDNGFPYVGYDDGIVSGNLITKGAMLMICRTYVRVNYDLSLIHISEPTRRS